MPSNTAAWVTAAKTKSLEVKAAPYTRPLNNEIVVKNGAVAINPADWMMTEEIGSMIYPWIKYPFVIGTDVAGEVVEVGAAVTRFKVGDRVVGFAVGTAQKYNTSAKGAFQMYTVLLEHMSSAIPSTLSYERAAVIPLGLSTASCGLFQKDQLDLRHPTVKSNPTGQTLLVWGGSTSVGSNAIQLAVAAGYEVITTSSPRNFDYVKNLGASQVFDYNSKTIVPDLVHAFKGKTCAGAFSIGPGAADACLDILPQCDGNKFLSMATYPLPQTPPKRLVLPSTIFSYVSWNVFAWFKGKARGIRFKFVFGDTLVDNGVGKVIYEDFLPKALAEGTFVPAPEPLVVGKGVEYVQAGFDLQKKGVSAKKVVVSL
ncbi:hypothetical protein MMC24_006509 [Lignoscripta atroalba]|nr:hypothetical protein [Lignoscripta atroalba]